MTVERLQEMVSEFARRRDWEQFHTPKNLVMALTGEVGELSEIFQWLTPEESLAIRHSDAGRSKVDEELADVFLYLVRLADVLDVDLVAVAEAKVRLNERRYPADKARGRAVKYSELDSGDATVG
ncbi:nucleotide pyrophosphohydrolase [Nocardia uniformis]|uniref:Nucleotide pyrophosphohydrolase n=1 Tax=Nocardia uniformis TaxID=53432 RepID=A0A849C0L8_9NOCA|nr:nucleotide pyrophosphohydrolase [Nocardia uniformis]NNH72313.1 nucleotide pyrophosphohydrolase [Nocardia uniformis]